MWNGEERAAMQAVCRPCTKQVAVALSPNAGTRGSEAQRGRKPPIGCLVEGKAGTQALCMLNDMHGHAHGFCVLSIYSDASFSSSPCQNFSLYTFSIFISQKGGVSD